MKRGFIYRARMRRADRVWSAQRRAERRIYVETGAMKESFQKLAVRLSQKAHRIEDLARNGWFPK